jgi:hypothetical protein
MTIEERMEKLERELVQARHRNRWQLGALILVLAGLGLTLARVWTKPAGIAHSQTDDATTKVIHANGFVLEDVNGAVRARLDLVDGYPAMRLLDATAKPRVILGAPKEGPSLVLVDWTAKNGAVLSALEGGPSLAMGDASGSNAVSLGVSKEGPDLLLTDKTGKNRVGLYLSDDEPALRLCDRNGKTVVHLTATVGAPWLFLYGLPGKSYARLGADELALADEKGRVRARMELATGWPMLDLMDEQENIRTVLHLGKEGPTLRFSDEKGTGRLTLGANKTVMPDGTQVSHPESSLWLFGPDGKGLWSAP